MKKNNFFSYFAVIIALIAIPVSVSLVQKQQEIRKYAAPATVLSFSPISITAKTNEIITFTGKINTDTNVASAAEIHLKFDPLKLQAISIENGTFFPNVFKAGQIDNTTGTASIASGCNVTTPQKGIGDLFVIKFKVLSKAVSDQYQISYDTQTLVSAKGEGGRNVLIGSLPVAVMTTIKTDINNDRKVDILDYNLLIEDFGKSGKIGFSPADINRNGKVDIFDFNLIIEAFGQET